MKETALFEVFVCRVDIYVSELRKTQSEVRPFHKNISFKKAIDHLCDSSNRYGFSLWVWNLHPTPVYVPDDPVWQLVRLWCSGGTKSHMAFVNSLPPFYQQCIVVMLCYIQMHGSSGTTLTAKCGTSMSMVKDFMGEEVAIPLM
jgi:hypothetical protein